ARRARALGAGRRRAAPDRPRPARPQPPARRTAGRLAGFPVSRYAFSARVDDLFAPSMLQLVDDAEGGIRYWPRFLDAATAADWFERLQAGAAWTAMQ